MIKALTFAACCSLALGGLAGSAFAQTYYSPPMHAPGTTYFLPPVTVEPSDFIPPALLYEGRSVRIGDPAAFYNSPDEMGYPTGLPQSPQND